MSAISNRKNIHDPKSTKPPLDSSARLPASHRNHLGKVHGKSEERYTVISLPSFCGSAFKFLDGLAVICLDKVFL